MAALPFYYSMVVDSQPLHPYQAYILLFTLERFGAVPRERIIAQCTERVPTVVRQTLVQKGYTVTNVAPYLDEIHCNKIAQLDYFMNAIMSAEEPDESGIFLLDLDLAVLSPLSVPDRKVIWGKIVDDANPPLPTLERIFSAADAPPTGIVPCDWESGETFSSNFNGGFLYVPLPFVARLRMGWRRWAEFLFARAELFDEPAQRKHIDQISLALAMVSERIPHRRLTANWNFPCHSSQRPRTYETPASVYVLRYGDRLDPYGLVAPAFSDPAIDTAVERVNVALGEQGDPTFFALYKKHRVEQATSDVPFIPVSPFSKDFLARTHVNGTPRRLILHAGIPKTGTTSLQWYLGSQRGRLAGEGVWYPPSSHWRKRKPSHPRFFHALLHGADDTAFVECVQEMLKDMPEATHTIILSAEAIFNHWQDIPPRAKGLLRYLASLFDTEICVWFREPDAFAASLYANYITFPRTAASPANVYGRDVSFDEAMQDDWFRKHLDFLGFYYEVQHLLGPDHVTPFLYSGKTVETFLRHYAICRGQAVQAVEVARWHNVRLSATGVRLMRFFNRLRGLLPLPSQERVKSIVRGIDYVLRGMVPAFCLTEQQATLVNRYAGRGWAILQAECRKSAASRQAAR